MIKTLIFKVPGEFPLLTEMIDAAKIHPMSYAKMKKQYTELVRVYVLSQMGGAKIVVSECSIHLHWVRRTRQADPDNIRPASKFVLDGLVASKVLEDDRQKNITNLSDSWNADKDNPRVEIEMRFK